MHTYHHIKYDISNDMYCVAFFNIYKMSYISLLIAYFIRFNNENLLICKLHYTTFALLRKFISKIFF